MMFWTLSTIILMVVAVACFWPLLRAKRSWKISALAGVLAVPLAVAALYQNVGTPQALQPQVADPSLAGIPDMDALVEQLRARLSEDPEQVEGWVLLARSYKSLKKYPQALEALETANRLVPNQPIIEVELVEAQLFVSGNPRISPEMKATLEKAVATDPGMQKGLWLLGIASAQSGDDEQAIASWELLLGQVDPNGDVARTVNEQIAEARQRLGQPAAPATPAVRAAAASPESWAGLDITVALDSGSDTALPEFPPEAVLFIIARAEGMEAGPPLGVRRVDRPQFPVEIRLGDEDSMMPQRPISSSANLKLQARLSMQGQALSAAGDWQTVAINISRDSAERTVLLLAPTSE